MNIPQNSTYENSGTEKQLPTIAVRSYPSLAGFASQGSPFQPQDLPTEGTPEYWQNLDSTLKALLYQQNPPQTGASIQPLEGDPRTKMEVPDYYSGFKSSGSAPGGLYKWETPQQPMIGNLTSGDAQAQYGVDLKQPDALIKSERGRDDLIQKSILAGRPSFLYEVDHALPIALGGVDTDYNKVVLPIAEHKDKTRAQSVPYTLYASGLITKQAAQGMAMQWKDRDLSQIPDADENTGLIPVEIAKEVAEQWRQVPKTTLKSILAALPDAAKNIGKGWMPEGLRTFVKSFSTGATTGFIPYERDDEDFSTFDKILEFSGFTAGGLAGFMGFVGGLGALTKGAMAIKTAAGVIRAGGLRTLKKKTTKELLETLLGGPALTTEEKLARAVFGEELSLGQRLVSPITQRGRDLAMKSTPLVPRSLNKGLGSITAGRLAKTTGQFLGYGEFARQIESKYNPAVLSGQEPERVIEDRVKGMTKDLFLGIAMGTAAPSLKGVAQAFAAPMMIEFASNPEDPVGALSTGLIFGALHSIGVPGGKKKLNEMRKIQEKAATEFAVNRLREYDPNFLSGWKPGDKIENKTLFNDFGNVWEISAGIRKQSEAPRPMREGEPLKKPVSATEFDKEFKSLTAMGNYLYRNNLPELQKQKMDIDNIFSYTKRLQEKRIEGLTSDFGKPITASKLEQLFQEKWDTFSKPLPDVATTDQNLNGFTFVTGLNENANPVITEAFLAQKKANNASNLLSFHTRDDIGGFIQKINELGINVKKDTTVSLDDRPRDALQVFGYVKNPETGKIEAYDLGWIASNERLNNEKIGYNAASWIKDGTHPRAEADKNILIDKMRAKNLGTMFMDIHKSEFVSKAEKRAKGKDAPDESYIMGKIRDAHWDLAEKLKAELATAEKTMPIEYQIAKAKTQDAFSRQETIKNITEQNTEPASELLPALPPEAPSDVKIQREGSNKVLTKLEDALSESTPEAVQMRLFENFGIKVDKAKAEELAQKTPTVKEGLEVINEAIASGNIDKSAEFEARLAANDFKSPDFKASDQALFLDKVKIPKKETVAPPVAQEGEFQNVMKNAGETPAESKKKIITRESLRQNPDKIYLFGDNLQRVGLGGQAKEMRGEPNAIGIPTKKSPSMGEGSFFTDTEFEQNKKAIDDAFVKIPPGKEIVIPQAGLGTGLAQLEQRAPETFKYLQDKLAKLKIEPLAESKTSVVKLPQTSPYTAKDQLKSNQANKFIGRGSQSSSTEAYRQAWGENANTGKYNKTDTVFISSEGNRPGRIKPDFDEIQKAIDAGARIIIDNKSDRMRSYNVGEREVTEFLTKRFYNEVKDGIWEPSIVETPAESKTLTAEDILKETKVKEDKINEDFSKDLITGEDRYEQVTNLWKEAQKRIREIDKEGPVTKAPVKEYRPGVSYEKTEQGYLIEQDPNSGTSWANATKKGADIKWVLKEEPIKNKKIDWTTKKGVMVDGKFFANDPDALKFIQEKYFSKKDSLFKQSLATKELYNRSKVVLEEESYPAKGVYNPKETDTSFIEETTLPKDRDWFTPIEQLAKEDLTKEVLARKDETWDPKRKEELNEEELEILNKEIAKFVTPKKIKDLAIKYDVALNNAKNFAKKVINKTNKLDPLSRLLKQRGLFGAEVKKEVQEMLLNDLAWKIVAEGDVPFNHAKAAVDTVRFVRYDKSGDIMSQTKKTQEVLPEKFLTTLQERQMKNRKLFRVESGKEFVSWIQNRKSLKWGTYEHALLWILDKLFTSKFGKGYETKDDYLQLIGRVFGTQDEAAIKFKKYASNIDPQGSGGEISDDLNYFLARAETDRRKTEQAKEAREEEIGEEQENRFLSMSRNTKDSTSDFESGAGNSVAEQKALEAGLRFSSPGQNRVEGLTRQDKELFPGLTAIMSLGKSNEGPQAIAFAGGDGRNVFQFFISENNIAAEASRKGKTKTEALKRKFIIPPEGKKYANLTKASDKVIEDLINEYNTELKKWEDTQVKVTEASKTPTVEEEQAYLKLKNQLESIQKAILDKTERSSWETPEILNEQLEDVKTLLAKYKNLKITPTDGGGGPGIHDGRGGIGDMWSNLKQTINTTKDYYLKGPPTYTSERALNTEPSYSFRGLKATDKDLDEAANILYGEISNRTPERQQFEIKHIINTVVNRAQNNPNQFGKTFLEVLQRPYQYQGYAPEGITVKGGKTIESQYQRARDKKLNEMEQKRYQRIRDVLNEIKSGNFEDTTGGAMYYVHASDGTLWLGRTLQEAKNNANNHEKALKGNVTKWGTAVGLPAKITYNN